MCHGQECWRPYRLGARRAFINTWGILFLIEYSVQTRITDALPVGMFGVLLIVVAVELKARLKTDNYWITGLIAQLAVLFGLA